MQIEKEDNGCVLVINGRRFNFAGNVDATAATVAEAAMKHALREPPGEWRKGLPLAPGRYFYRNIKGKPKYIGCETFSEPCPNVSGYTFIIAQSNAPTFAQANKKLMDWIHTPNQRREWMQRSLMSRDDAAPVTCHTCGEPVDYDAAVACSRCGEPCHKGCVNEESLCETCYHQLRRDGV